MSIRTIAEVQEAVRATKRFRPVGLRTKTLFLPDSSGEELSLAELTGIVEFEPADQVVVVLAGTTIAELQETLKEHGLCLPVPSPNEFPPSVAGFPGTVGGLLAMNLPHGLQAQAGGPREWTLGLQVVRSDGTVAKCGSKVVKSVAGYDVHKLFVGSRGELGVIVSATLRALPIGALPLDSVDLLDDSHEPRYIQRTLPSEFDDAVQRAERIQAIDRASCTLWCDDEPSTTAEGWVIGPRGYRKRNPQPSHLEARAEELFNPDGRFVPGWAE